VHRHAGRGRFDVEDGVIPKSPVAGIENERVQRAPPDPLAPDEIEAVRAATAKLPHQREFWRDYFEFTGLRPSE
jgi:hypothetical protein